MVGAPPAKSAAESAPCSAHRQTAGSVRECRCLRCRRARCLSNLPGQVFQKRHAHSRHRAQTHRAARSPAREASRRIVVLAHARPICSPQPLAIAERRLSNDLTSKEQQQVALDLRLPSDETRLGEQDQRAFLWRAPSAARRQVPRRRPGGSSAAAARGRWRECRRRSLIRMLPTSVSAPERNSCRDRREATRRPSAA